MFQFVKFCLEMADSILLTLLSTESLRDLNSCKINCRSVYLSADVSSLWVGGCFFAVFSHSMGLRVLHVLLFEFGVSLVFALKISDIFGVDLSLDMMNSSIHT